MRTLLAAAVAVAVCLAACAEILPVTPVEAVAEASDDLFLLTVRSPSARHAPGAAIDVAAELVYQGPKNRETVYHAASPVGWQIVQLDGPAVMGGGMDMPCLTTEVVPGHVRRYPFEKAGQVEETGPFGAAWFQQDELTLPPGRWRISADMNVALEDCGGEPHALHASIDLLVEP